jgi:hypothetical protein
MLWQAFPLLTRGRRTGLAGCGEGGPDAGERRQPGAPRPAEIDLIGVRFDGSGITTGIAQIVGVLVSDPAPLPHALVLSGGG